MKLVLLLHSNFFSGRIGDFPYNLKNKKIKKKNKYTEKENGQLLIDVPCAILAIRHRQDILKEKENILFRWHS